MIAINNLYMAKMPKSCKECPLTYLDTGDDAYFGANERKCVIDDSCVDGMVSERAYDCPLVEAISKADYEAKLKADKIAMLTELKADIEKMPCLYVDFVHYVNEYDVSNLIQQKINELKTENNHIN